ncbi:hypothetical protein [Aeromicrobium sp.]|uniref:hypothetical protein n=1 Tax=Aeromicrobium sp. TaxID=1871063 RepID=UPI0035132A6C
MDVVGGLREGHGRRAAERHARVERDGHGVGADALGSSSDLVAEAEVGQGRVEVGVDDPGAAGVADADAGRREGRAVVADVGRGHVLAAQVAAELVARGATGVGALELDHVVVPGRDGRLGVGGEAERHGGGSTGEDGGDETCRGHASPSIRPSAAADRTWMGRTTAGAVAVLSNRH